MPNPNNKNIIKDIDFKVQCPECRRWFNIPLISHHFVNYYMKRYLMSIGRFDEKQVESLRRKLQVKICKDCEQQKHDGDVFEVAWKEYIKRLDEEENV